MRVIYKACKVCNKISEHRVDRFETVYLMCEVCLNKLAWKGKTLTGSSFTWTKKNETT